MNETTPGYSAFSSAWFELVYGDGNARERLANALTRVITVTTNNLTQEQQQLLQRLGTDRICNLDSKQMLELTETLDESKMHELTETIAQLYLVTVQPYEP